MSNESNRGSNPTPRVYKSSDVHKRRAGGSSRADKSTASRKGANPLASQVPDVIPDPDAEEKAAAAARQAALQSSLPAVDSAQDAKVEGLAAELPAVEPAEPATPAAEIAKAAEEITLDETVDRQTFENMPTTRLQAIGDFVTKQVMGSPDPAPAPFDGGPDGLSGKTESFPATDGAPTLMEHAAFARQAGRSGMNVSQIDPGRQNEGDARRRRVVVAATAVIAVVIVAAIAVFAWNRWGRFDDRVDIQGEWYVVDTTVPVQIDDHSIKLTDSVAYEYVIDQNEKTIKYTFGTMEGQGRYWFSEDRQYLVITDGDNYSGTSTTVEDLVRTFSELTATVTGQDVKLPEGNGIIAFSRNPDPKAQAEKEQAAAKAKEEQEKKAAAEREAANSEDSASAASSAAAATTDEYEDDEYYYEDDEYAYDESDEEYTDEETDVSDADAEFSEEEAATDEEVYEDDGSAEGDEEYSEE